MNKSNVFKVLIFSLALAVLIYPGFEKLYLYRQTNILEDLVMAPLDFLGEGQTILSNDDKFTRYGTKYEGLDLVRGSDLFIGIKNEFLPHTKWINLSEERDRVFKEKQMQLGDFNAKLSDGEYSLVVYGPNTFESDIFQLIYSLKNMKNGIRTILLDDYCEIFLPSAEHKCVACKDTIRAFFKDKEVCNKFLPEVVNHYTNAFFKICRYDEFVANIKLKSRLAENGFFIKDKCSGGGRLLSTYTNKLFTLTNLLNLAYLSLILTALFFLKFKHGKIFIIIFLVIFLLYFPLNIFNSNYITTSYINESNYTYATVNIPAQLLRLEELKPAQTENPAKLGAIGTADSEIRSVSRYDLHF